jgi:hypothetical protein
MGRPADHGRSAALLAVFHPHLETVMEMSIRETPKRTHYPEFFDAWRKRMGEKFARRNGVKFPVRLELPSQLQRHCDCSFVFLTKDGHLAKDEKGDGIIHS